MSLDIIVLLRDEWRAGYSTWYLYDVNRDQEAQYIGKDVPRSWCDQMAQYPPSNPHMMASLLSYVEDVMATREDPMFYVYCAGRVYRCRIKRLASKRWSVIRYEITKEEGTEEQADTFTFTAKTFADAIGVAILAVRRDITAEQAGVSCRGSG